MTCNTLLDNFLRISGLFFWAIAVLAAIVIYKQKEQIRTMLATKKMMKNMKGMMTDEKKKDNDKL